MIPAGIKLHFLVLSHQPLLKHPAMSHLVGGFTTVTVGYLLTTNRHGEIDQLHLTDQRG